jgi:pyruvate formate lyase activating enzyme
MRSDAAMTLPLDSTASEVMGTVFNIQRFSTQDGPGIRTTVFLKGCPLKCFWCQNPESQMTAPEVLLSKDKCTACGRCVEACPAGAARLSDGGATIDRDRCLGCGQCVEACPNSARSLAGRRVPVDEVVREVLKDRTFYENSGGGVTLSGGEPTMQFEFVSALLRKLKSEGLHTALDTCGYVSRPLLEKLLEFTDLVLFDIKCIDSDKHFEAAGVRNDIILENFKSVYHRKPVTIRVPLIPQFNDTIEEVTAIARFVKKEAGTLDIDLLHYNSMGEIKYRQLERKGVRLKDKGEEHLDVLNRAVSSVMKEKNTSEPLEGMGLFTE